MQMRSRKHCKLLICSVILGRSKIFDALSFIFLLETNYFAIPLNPLLFPKAKILQVRSFLRSDD